MSRNEQKILVIILIVIPIVHSFYFSTSSFFNEKNKLYESLSFVLFTGYFSTYLIWILLGAYHYFCMKKYHYVIILVIHIIFTFVIPEYYLQNYLWNQKNTTKLNHAVVIEIVPYKKIYYLYKEDDRIYQASIEYSHEKYPYPYENYQVGDTIKIRHLINHHHISKWEPPNNLNNKK